MDPSKGFDDWESLVSVRHTQDLPKFAIFFLLSIYLYIHNYYYNYYYFNFNVRGEEGEEIYQAQASGFCVTVGSLIVFPLLQTLIRR